MKLLQFGKWEAALAGVFAAAAAFSSPVSCEHIVRHNPNYSIHVVKIKLTDPHVTVRVSRGGDDPDGAGPWVTTLLPTTEVAQREHFDIAVNGDFFIAQNTYDIEGKKTGYIRGKFAAPEGLAMTDGKLWHASTNGHPYLEITSSHRAEVVQGSAPVDRQAQEVVSGRQILIWHGKLVPLTNKFAITKNPRTAVGVNKRGTELVLFVVDGRQPNLSIGMTLGEMAQEMKRLGCYNALNLDGGGSTTLVYRDAKTGKLDILNSPSDTKERSVADVLGIDVGEPLPPVSER